MKVKVIASRHGHIAIGTIGEADGIFPDTFKIMSSATNIAVSFKKIKVPVPGYNEERPATVNFFRSELQACK